MRLCKPTMNFIALGYPNSLQHWAPLGALLPVRMTRLGVGLVLAIATLQVIAAPAPWFMWKSKVDGKIFCAQTSPGEGWKRVGGPFKDARCERPA